MLRNLTSYVGIGTGTHAKDKVSDQTRMGQDAFTSLMRHAIDKGIRLIDTADSYGTHQMLAIAMDGHLKGRAREEFCIQTKTMATTATGVRADAERFCRELQTDYLDHLLLHCVETPDWPKQMRGAADELMKLKEEGMVRQIGVSIHGLEALCAATSCGWPDIFLVRINHDGAKMDARPEIVVDILKQLKAQDQTLIGMKVFGAGRYDRATCRESLRWVKSLELCSAVVLGLTTPDQIDEAFAVA